MPKIASPPLVFFHPEDFFRIRDAVDSKDAVPLKLLRSITKGLLEDSTVHSVTFSKRPSPAGPNGFLSFAPYFHPDEAQKAAYLRQHSNAPPSEWEDKIEWHRADGRRNPDNGGATQGDELNAVCDKVVALALSYHFACKLAPQDADKFAAKAYQLLWVFFGDTRTAMLPEVVYGQYIRGCQEKSTNRPEGLLHVRNLVRLSQVLPLLPAPPSPHSPHAFMHAWLTRHVDFLYTSEVARRAQQRSNNIGTYYYVCLATHLLALNRAQEAVQLIAPLFADHARGIASKIAADGQLLHEVVRTNPFHYTCFELQALVYLADLLASISTFQPYGAHSRALCRAIDYAFALADGKGQQKPERGFDKRELVFVLGSASRHYPDRDYSSWLGKGKDMENGQVETMKGWNVRGRLFWSMKQLA